MNPMTVGDLMREIDRLRNLMNWANDKRKISSTGKEAADMERVAGTIAHHLNFIYSMELK